MALRLTPLRRLRLSTSLPKSQFPVAVSTRLSLTAHCGLVGWGYESHPRLPPGSVRVFRVVRWVLPCMADRATLYIDGGNFHHLVLRKLQTAERHFDFEGFAQFLADGRSLARKTFYTGTVREREGEPRTKEAMARQTAFFTALSKQGWNLETSKLRRRRETIVIDDRVANYQALIAAGLKEISYVRDREKGIDVKLAVDLIIDALDDRYDVALVVSSDADLLPAIACVRERFGKRVEYVGFSLPDRRKPEASTRPLLTLMKNTDVQRTLVESDLTPFVLPKRTA